MTLLYRLGCSAASLPGVARAGLLGRLAGSQPIAFAMDRDHVGVMEEPVRMAVTDGTSPMSLPQSSKVRFKVIILERFSYRRMMISERYSPERFGNGLSPMSSTISRSGLR